jgi:hypothetical protein
MYCTLPYVRSITDIIYCILLHCMYGLLQIAGTVPYWTCRIFGLQQTACTVLKCTVYKVYYRQHLLYCIVPHVRTVTDSMYCTVQYLMYGQLQTACAVLYCTAYTVWYRQQVQYHAVWNLLQTASTVQYCMYGLSQPACIVLYFMYGLLQGECNVLYRIYGLLQTACTALYRINGLLQTSCTVPYCTYVRFVTVSM